MVRRERTVSASFEKDDYDSMHYLFKGDTIDGKVICPDSCTIQVYYRYSVCVKRYPYEYNLGRRRSKSNRCRYYDKVIYEQDVKGELDFFATAPVENPYHVYVYKSLLRDPTGTITYKLNQTSFNVSKYVQKCSTYKCKFENITGEEHLFVTQFSDKMVGSYWMDATYRQDKEYNNAVAAGFGWATLAIFIVVVICVTVSLLFHKFHDEPSSSSSSSSSVNMEEKKEETPGETAAESKPVQDTPAPSDAAQPADAAAVDPVYTAA